MSRDEAGNCLCGIAVSLHFDAKNRMKGCAWAAQQTKPVDRGRLFKLKVQKNHESRQAALKTVRPVVLHGEIVGYQARIGGPVRGVTVFAARKETVVADVNEHYNAAMLDYVERRQPAKR